MTSFDHMIVVHNSKATHATRAQRLAVQARELLNAERYDELDLAKTALSHSAALEIFEGAGPGTLLCVGGGDGTVGSVVNALLGSDVLKQHNQKAVIFPLWGGNVNDLAVMLNGLIRTNQLSATMRQARPVMIQPIKIRMQLPNGQVRERLAVSYVGFGLSAHTLWVMEDSAHDRTKLQERSSVHRTYNEFRDMIHIWKTAPSFKMSTADKKHAMYELLFINGSRIARVDRIPNTLTTPKYYRVGIKDRTHLASHVARTLAGQTTGVHSSDVFRFMLESETRCQADGEIHYIEPGTEVEVSMSEQAFCALSRRLSDQKKGDAS